MISFSHSSDFNPISVMIGLKVSPIMFYEYVIRTMTEEFEKAPERVTTLAYDLAEKVKDCVVKDGIKGIAYCYTLHQGFLEVEAREQVQESLFRNASLFDNSIKNAFIKPMEILFRLPIWDFQTLHKVLSEIKPVNKKEKVLMADWFWKISASGISDENAEVVLDAAKECFLILRTDLDADEEMYRSLLRRLPQRLWGKEVYET